MQASAATAAGGSNEIADRTSVITGKLKTIYRKTVLPVEKRFKYDYFYESPFLSDCEFDGTYHIQIIVVLSIPCLLDPFLMFVDLSIAAMLFSCSKSHINTLLSLMFYL